MQNPNYVAPPPAAGKSSTGLDANVAALLSYLFGGVGGLVFFLIEKESRFVRFHAMQSIMLNVGVIVVFIALTIVNVMLAFVSATLAGLFSLLWFVVMLGFLGLAILCMVKAFQNQEFRLPVVGDMAANIANK
jgi:uncharacterized membrane protein